MSKFDELVKRILNEKSDDRFPGDEYPHTDLTAPEEVMRGRREEPAKYDTENSRFVSAATRQRERESQTRDSSKSSLYPGLVAFQKQETEMSERRTIIRVPHKLGMNIEFVTPFRAAGFTTVDALGKRISADKFEKVLDWNDEEEYEIEEGKPGATFAYNNGILSYREGDGEVEEILDCKSGELIK